MIDPLETIEPRPMTSAARRTIAAVGGLAILVAVAVLVRALGSGAVPVSAADELSRTTPRHPASDRAVERR